MPDLQEWMYLFTKQNEKIQERSPVGQVNWEPGRLLQHQSFESFGVLFCAVNHISARVFVEYWDTKFQSRREECEERLYRIAKLLHEPLPVVATVFGDHDRRGKLFSFESQRDTISYCPLCISAGFHGRFHEATVFMKCPIHGIGLSREVLVGGGATHVMRMERLQHLFEQRVPNWPRNNMAIDYANPQKFPALAELLKWEKSIRGASGWEVVELYENDIDRRFLPAHLDIWLGREAWNFPVSEQVTNLFLVKPWFKVPVVYRFNNDLARELTDLTSKIKLSRILSTYKMSRLFWDETTPYSPFVRDVIESHRINHDRIQCKCVWGKGVYDPWRRFERDVMQDYHSILCPHRYAANELQKSWFVSVLRPRLVKPKVTRWRRY